MSKTLGGVDYFLCSLLMLSSLGIGMFFAFFERKKHNKGGQTEEFLLGGRQMAALPVACSIMASFFSAITLLGTPNEIYQYGIMYIFIGFGYVLTILISTVFFIPVFYNMRITSSYEYLSLRFSRINQVMGAVSFIVQMTPYMGIALYGPALALTIVMNVNKWFVIVTMTIICTIYTTLGGLKAVIWTDVLQLMIMFIGMFTIILKGIVDAHGFGSIMKTAKDNERFTLNFSFDPRTRHSFWSMIFGGSSLWCGIYCINQTMIQRAICVKSLKEAKIGYIINLPGMISLLIVVVLCGLVIFHYFCGCDPLISMEINKSDQLVPLYVSRVLLYYPGVGGIFVAGILSGGLSTLSSGLNALAAVTLQDIVMLKYVNINDRTAMIISKSLVVLYGCTTLLFAYISSLTSKLLEAALGLFGMLSGPLLGVFSLGMFFPFSNYKGAIAGHLVSQIFVFWVGFGFYANKIVHPKLARSNYNCSGNGNFTIPTGHIITYGDKNEPLTGIYNLYAISYLWYTLIGCMTTVLVGISVSFLTGRTEKVQMQFITPPLRQFWKDYLIEDVEIKHSYDLVNSIIELNTTEVKSNL